jgi:hypothetical protein
MKSNINFFTVESMNIDKFIFMKSPRLAKWQALPSEVEWKTYADSKRLPP